MTGELKRKENKVILLGAGRRGLVAAAFERRRFFQPRFMRKDNRLKAELFEKKFWSQHSVIVLSK
jgi:hypothetical protein